MEMRTTEAIAILWVAMALHAATSEAQGQDEDVRAVEVLLEGRALTPEQVAEREKRLDADPDDLDSRSRLLGYYWSRRFEHPEEQATRQGHVFWIIENAPGSGFAGSVGMEMDAILEPDAYQEASRLWQKHVESPSCEAAVLGNAASYFLLHDESRAQEYYRRAKALEPESPQWPRKLSALMRLEMLGKSGEERAGLAKEALQLREESVSLDSSHRSRFFALDELAELSFEAGEWPKAQAYSTELLEQATSPETGEVDGRAVHVGHTVLGRLALRDGDVEEAKRRLLEAGAAPGSVSLGSAGPSMWLAKELLEAGERDVVLEYLGRCTRFWKRDKGRLDQWAKDIREGRPPDFGSQAR